MISCTFISFTIPDHCLLLSSISKTAVLYYDIAHAMVLKKDQNPCYNVTNSRAKPQQTPSVEKHAHPLRYILKHLLDSQSFEFEICILQALNMPLIRCTNVFFQGRLSRHITSPSEKTRLVLGTTWVRQIRSGVVIIPPLPPNVTNGRAKPQQTQSVEKHAHPQGWLIALYSQHLLASQSFEFLLHITPDAANTLHRILPRDAISSHYFPLREHSPRVLAWGLHG